METPTSRDNIERVLYHLGLSGAVDITKSDPDRVWGWCPDDRLLQYCIFHRWYQDDVIMEEHFHGEHSQSFRERHVRPALQVVFHPIFIPGPDAKYFVELDIDYISPTGFGIIRHIGEVLANTLLRRKTDQEKISRLLDKRFA
jgi:hypothetical protein